jgi:hypothetical protein
MTDTYRGGYKKAILDILEMIVKRDDSHLNSKKKYKKFLSTYLMLLLQNPQVLDSFMQYGGAVWNNSMLPLKIREDGTIFLDG